MISRRQRIFRVLGLLVVAALAGCVAYPIQHEYFPVPPWVIAQVPARMQRLQLGMTRQQALQTLGLLGDCGPQNGSGPRADFREGYRLGPGCGLRLVFDRSTQPNRLKRADLHGSGWTQWPANLSSPDAYTFPPQ